MSNESHLGKTINDHRNFGSTPPSAFPKNADPDTPLINLASQEYLDGYIDKQTAALRSALEMDNNLLKRMEERTSLTTLTAKDLDLLRSKGIDTTEAETYLSQLKSKLSK